ncbi:MAG TPA: plastocyanin/azurin family copper-binding protein, partial [Acidimicrobiia bacterium]|nr:plastocyanin/azurin family copper-binding protein [Acidimicrobiia bacterium]
PDGSSPGTSTPAQPPTGSPAPSAPATGSVAILDRSFSPSGVTIAPGGTVSWTNQSDRDHTVTGTGFDSGVLGGGGRFSHTFPSIGTFTYICELHSEMRASVTVAGGAGSPEPGPSPAATAPTPAPAAPATSPAPQPQPTPATGAAGATRHHVAVVDYAFRPANISARVGDGVVWTNQGRAPHTATAAGAFDTGMFRAGEQRTTTLRTVGTFAFACTIHPEMTGVLTVAAATGGSVPAASPGPATADQTVSPAISTSTTAPAAPVEAATPETAEVSIVDLAFEPATVRLAVGGTVTWRHNGIAPHTVTAEDSSFNSGLLQAGGTFSHRFDRAGTFQYICAFHPGMAGAVEIVESPSEPAPGLDAGSEQAASSVRNGRDSSLSGTAVLAALLGGAALLAGTGALLYGGSRMLAADDRP